MRDSTNTSTPAALPVVTIDTATMQTVCPVCGGRDCVAGRDVAVRDNVIFLDDDPTMFTVRWDATTFRHESYVCTGCNAQVALPDGLTSDEYLEN